MSRSYKKFIVCKDDNSKFGKRLANKTVRRNENVPDGAKFKRYFCSWNICDYHSKSFTLLNNSAAGGSISRTSN